MRTFWLIAGLIVWMLMGNPERVLAQANDGNIVGQLVKEGFVNVRYANVDGVRIYSIENDSYKIQAAGVSKALQIIQSDLRGNENCKVVVTRHNVPQLVMEYGPTENAPESGIVALTDWKASYEVEEAWKKVKSEEVNNSSRFKVDVLIYPQLAFRNLVVTQIYQYVFDLSPAVEVSLWPGSKLSGMVKIPVLNDGFGDLEGKVHPGHLTLSQRFLLPYNVRGRVTMGYFNANRYGVDAQLFYPFKDQRFTLGGRVGYVGYGYWDGFNLHYDKDMSVAWSVEGSFFWPKYNTQFILRAQQWLMKDKGIKFEMIRHFRYASVGFYAEKATTSLASTNGGFRFQIALPPYKQKRHGYVPRITTSGQMGLVYNAGNEQYYYKEYKAEASDNIMEANSFNPLYIQNEMYNF